LSKFYLSKNRDRLSIVTDVLEAAKTGANKTMIMSLANLSFKLLEKYLYVAVSSGFIQIDHSTYFLTQDGADFLKRCKAFRKRYARAQTIVAALGSEHEELWRQCEERLIGELRLGKDKHS